MALPAPEMPVWLEKHVPFDRYMVEVAPGIRMHVMEAGEGRPVVLFHGNPTWGFLYRKVVAELDGEPLRLIMPDLVGLGFSDRVPNGADYTLANHVKWTAALLGELGLEDAVGVVQDWGGPIGVLSMSRHPGLMKGLVLMNTSVTAPKPGFKPTLFHRLFSSRVGGALGRLFGLPQRALWWAQGDRSSITGDVSKAYAFPLSRGRGNLAAIELVRMVPDSMEHPTVPLLEESEAFLRGFDGRSAIVWGTSDPLLGRLLNRHRRLLPNAMVTETAAGHFLQEEVPGDVADAIRDVAL